MKRLRSSRDIASPPPTAVGVVARAHRIDDDGKMSKLTWGVVGCGDGVAARPKINIAIHVILPYSIEFR